MAISQNIFEKFNHYLDGVDSVLELGNQTFVNECVTKYNTILNGYNHTTPVKKYVESKNKKHVSIDITGLDESLPFDLNSDTILDIGEFDLVTNFGTTEHIEPNQFEPFFHIHNLCKVGGIMIHEVPVFNHWPGHCRYYYDENFFLYLSKKNNYDILEMERINYGSVGDLIFVALKKTNPSFLSEKKELELNIKISETEINIPQYWIKK
jgi:hypothetical protein